jgi:hypothetical protein
MLNGESTIGLIQLSKHRSAWLKYDSQHGQAFCLGRGFANENGISEIRGDRFQSRYNPNYPHATKIA